MTKLAYINGSIVRETEKALLINCALERGEEPVSGGVWFPRSEVEDMGDAHRELPEAVRAVLPPARTFAMPEWLAKKSGVCHGSRL